MAGDDAQQMGPLPVAVFLAELALLAVLAVAGARLVDGTAGRFAFALLLPLIAAVIWGRWLAPRARGRLGHAARLAAKLTLVAVASALLALTGPTWWGAAFLLVAGALFTAGELSERR